MNMGNEIRESYMVFKFVATCRNTHSLVICSKSSDSSSTHVVSRENVKLDYLLDSLRIINLK